MPITYDTGSANTLGANSNTVTTETITTAENNELLILFAFGADNVGFSSFVAATSPNVSSGTLTGALSNPVRNAWFGVFSLSSAIGADSTNALAHTVKGTAGDTGTLQATSSGTASRHGLIVGAFKLPSHIPTLSLPTYMPGSLTTSGFRPRVTATA